MDAMGAGAVTFLFWTACVLTALSLIVILTAKLIALAMKLEDEMVSFCVSMSAACFAVVLVLSGLYVVFGIDIAGSWWLFWVVVGWVFVLEGVGIGCLLVRDSIYDYRRKHPKEKTQ